VLRFEYGLGLCPAGAMFPARGVEGHMAREGGGGGQAKPMPCG